MRSLVEVVDGVSHAIDVPLLGGIAVAGALWRWTPLGLAEMTKR